MHFTTKFRTVIDSDGDNESNMENGNGNNLIRSAGVKDTCEGTELK